MALVNKSKTSSVGFCMFIFWADGTDPLFSNKKSSNLTSGLWHDAPETCSWNVLLIQPLIYIHYKNAKNICYHISKKMLLISKYSYFSTHFESTHQLISLLYPNIMLMIIYQKELFVSSLLCFRSSSVKNNNECQNRLSHLVVAL